MNITDFTISKELIANVAQVITSIGYGVILRLDCLLAGNK